MAVVAASAFAVALLALALELGHRTKIALVGASLVVVLGALDVETAIASIDWATLGLLVGMMIIVGLTEPTGVFSYLALHIARLSGGRPFRLIALLALMTAVLSAFLDNLTAILLVVPISLQLSRLLGLPVIPLVLVQVMASNIGGTATLIGDPPNIMIGTHVEQLSFIDFIVNLGPVAAVTLLVTTLVLYGFYRRSLKPVPDARDRLTGLDPRAELKRDRLFRILAVLGGTIVGFFLHAPLHVEPVVVAMTGATVMLLVAGRELEWALERVEWGTIFFFVGLFVMVGALEERGVIGSVADAFAAVTGGSKTAEALVILWGAAAGSAVVDNIPFTAAMIPVVDELQADGFDDATWWALALGACFGGNATLIAAAANVAAVSALGRTGTRISFLRFLAVGMPVTVVSLLIATAYLLAFQL
ncbi:MAG TPA: ArsB/NhaD family transporter [Gaiellaceae bacterium]